jgi:hypothetical protein
MGNVLAWFVHQPLRLAVLAVPFILAWLVLRRGSGSRAVRSRAALYPAGFFLAFAAWEWLVMSRSPEADIRVDLLVIWPIAGIVVVWALIRILRPGTVD